MSFELDHHAGADPRDSARSLWITCSRMCQILEPKRSRP